MRGSVLMKLMQSGFFFDTELGHVQIPFADIGYACKVCLNEILLKLCIISILISSGCQS